MIVRIQKAKIKNFRNVLAGEVRFPSNFEKDIFCYKSDVLGIYGQNGSGKTTFIDSVKLLKTLLMGGTAKQSAVGLITNGKSVGEAEFEFSVIDDEDIKHRIVYTVTICLDETGEGVSSINETVKAATLNGGKWSRMTTILISDDSDVEKQVRPATKKKELFGAGQSVADELRVIKLLCKKEARSFIFSKEARGLLNKEKPEAKLLIGLAYYGTSNLFVVTNADTGIISFGNLLPVKFRTEQHMGYLNLPINRAFTVQNDVYETMKQIIGSINKVLRQIIPGMELDFMPVGEELLKDGTKGCRVELVRVNKSKNGVATNLPLRYESDGIKKIISILNLLIATYNNPSMTLAIDELDSGIYEYLLGELIKIMQDTGKGQLVFTSHNLYPLEVLHSNCILFTTTDASDRYTRPTNIRPTNNLRDYYLREAALGSDNAKELYMETNSYEIAYAMRQAGRAANSVGPFDEGA